MAKSASNTINTELLYDLLMPSTDVSDFPTYEAPQQPIAPPAHTRLDELRQRMSGAGLPALAEPGSGVILVNLTETLVADRLDAAFDKFNCCKCDRCKKRAAAFALNDLTPNYVAATVEQVEELLNVCPTKDVATAVVRAVLRVKSTPEH